MLEAALSSEHCVVLRGRRFSKERHAALEGVLDDDASCRENTLVLYPGPTAEPIETLASVKERGRGYNLVVLDGTWSQARSLYHNSPQLHSLKQASKVPPCKMVTHLNNAQLNLRSGEKGKATRADVERYTSSRGCIISLLVKC